MIEKGDKIVKMVLLSPHEADHLFKKQMKVFAIEMLENYAKTTDNDVDDQLVARVKKAMRLGAV